MILSDREIRAALDREAIRITPDPRADSSVWSATALDLRLDGQLARWELPEGEARPLFSPHDPDYDPIRLIERYTQAIPIPDAGYPVEPGRFLLGWTVEKIQLPHRSRIAARVEGKSSLARLGLGVHVTAPTIHAGFGYHDQELAFAGNPIQLGIWNVGPLTMLLKRGMKVCQLIFEHVDGTPEQGYRGRFAVQGPTP